MRIQGNIVDIFNKRIYPGEIHIEGGKISSITELDSSFDHFILPGFVDAHIHIESSMLVPSEFARLAVIHGTVATVSDPHEIANVLGVQGVEYMINDGNKVPLKFNFGAPSCVPATSFETAGAVIDSNGIKNLLDHPEIKYLAEMMNYPGVLYEDPEVMRKIEIAKEIGKPIDGHAPGLAGAEAEKYIAAGISTDHECFTFQEAKGKLDLGMKVIIREGSAAKNFEALYPLLDDQYLNMMLCSDDKHPDDLIAGHINDLVARAIGKGIDMFKVLRAACVNPVEHYGLDVGLLREGDPADLIVVEDLESMKVMQTYIAGELVADAGRSFIQTETAEVINNFNCKEIAASDLRLEATGNKIRVIEALDGELITNMLIAPAKTVNGFVVSDLDRDILKIAVVNRYKISQPSIAFIKNFGLRIGAIASCVGHDSHNIIAVGVDDESLSRAINLIIENKGGISAVSPEEEKVLPLPIAGIMTNENGFEVARKYEELDAFAKQLGSDLRAPYMSLSFMGLLVIPSLKLSDLGLFDGAKFQFTELQVD